MALNTSKLLLSSELYYLDKIQHIKMKDIYKNTIQN